MTDSSDTGDNSDNTRIIVVPQVDELSPMEVLLNHARARWRAEEVHTGQLAQRTATLMAMITGILGIGLFKLDTLPNIKNGAGFAVVGFLLVALVLVIAALFSLLEFGRTRASNGIEVKRPGIIHHIRSVLAECWELACRFLRFCKLIRATPTEGEFEGPASAKLAWPKNFGSERAASDDLTADDLLGVSYERWEKASIRLLDYNKDRMIVLEQTQTLLVLAAASAAIAIAVNLLFTSSSDQAGASRAEAGTLYVLTPVERDED